MPLSLQVAPRASCLHFSLMRLPIGAISANSLALNLPYFAYRAKLTPTDPTAGLSEEIHMYSQLPSAEGMADKAAKKQKGELGPAVYGGTGFSAQPAAKDATPRSFQGNDENTVAMRTYLINYTLRKCDANLPRILQDRMCRVLWRIENGLGAHTADPPVPTMCPEFYAPCASADAKGASRSGIEQCGGSPTASPTAPRTAIKLHAAKSLPARRPSPHSVCW